MFCKDVSVTNTYTLTDYVGTGTADDLPREVGVFSKATKERKRDFIHRCRRFAAITSLEIVDVGHCAVSCIRHWRVYNKV